MTKAELLEDYKRWSDEKYCLEAVKQNGYFLQYVNKKEILETLIIKLNIK